MLTREMFLALLQGLPAADLSFLDRPWNLLAVRIERNLKKGLQPPDALHAALDDSPDWERQLHLRAFLHEDPVLALPDLSPRQKDALIVLRSLGSCSLAQLSRLLMRDRSNIRRTLEVLVAKSYIIKYLRKDGPAYLAITSPLSDQHRSEAIEILQAYKHFLIEGSTDAQASSLPVPPSIDAFPTQTTPTTTTTATTPTTPTTSTTPNTPNTKQRDVPHQAKPGRNSNAPASSADSTTPPTPTRETNPTTDLAPSATANAMEVPHPPRPP